MDRMGETPKCDASGGGVGLRQEHVGTTDLMQNDQMGPNQGRPEMFESSSEPRSVEEPVRESDCGVDAMVRIVNELEQKRRDTIPKCISGDAAPPRIEEVNPSPPGNKPKPGKPSRRKRKNKGQYSARAAGASNGEEEAGEISPDRAEATDAKRRRGDRVQANKKQDARLRRLWIGGRQPDNTRQTTPQLAARQKRCERRGFLAHA